MKKNKKLVVLPGLFLLLTVWGLYAFVNSDECDESGYLKKIYSSWGDRCIKCGDLSGKSYTIRYRNDAKYPLDVRVALQKGHNRGWQVFSFNHLAPKDSFQVCVCDGTSKVMKWAIKSGDPHCVLPTDSEIHKVLQH